MTQVPPDAWARDVFRTHEHDGWVVDLPVGVTGGPVTHTNPDITTVAIYRGYVEQDPMAVLVTTRPRAWPSLRGELRALTRWFHGGAVEGIPLDVPGGAGARCAEGLMDVEEGYGEAPQWTERVTAVAAACGRRQLVVLTVRRHPAAAVDDVVERIVASFALRRGA